MSVTMLDIHLKHVLDFGLKTVRANPDKHLRDIFGDFNLDPHAGLYGNRLIALVKNWVTKTEIPVVLGFDLSAAKIPAITVHLASTSPAQTYLADYGGTQSEELLSQEREIIIEKFVPKTLAWSSDKNSLKLQPPDDMGMEKRELFLAGLKIRDAKNREYDISQDEDGNTLIIQASDSAPLDQISSEYLEVVSPIIMARYSRGHMFMDEVATIAVHGHTDRNEGLWLYYITMWILLKYRPLMASTFGLDLALPSASDFSKDDSTLGTNTWVRFIQISAKSLWSWESARQGDVIALLASIAASK